jgi:hypothetical protein
VTERFRAAKGTFRLGPTGRRASVELGFALRALVCWWGATAETEVARGNSGGLGFCAEAQTAAAWASADGATPTHSARCVDECGILGIDPSGDVTLRAQLQLAPNGFAAEGERAPSSTWTVHYLALGGADLDAKVGMLESPTDAQRVSETDLGFEPDLILFAPIGAEAPDHTQRGLCAAIGAAARKDQAGTSYVARDGAEQGEVGGMQRGDAAIAVAADRVEPAALARISTEADGFNSDWSTVWPTPRLVPYLAVGGVRCNLGTAASPGSPGAQRVEVGFAPEALLVFTWGLSGRSEPADIGRLCVGGATADDVGCVSWDDRNVEARPANTRVRSSTTELLVVADTQTGGVHAAAALASLDRRGFRLDWTEADGAARELAYVALAGRQRQRSAFSRGS